MRAALLTAAAAVGVLVLPATGSAAPDPVFSAAPNPVGPGGTVELTITGCAGADPSTVVVGVDSSFSDSPGGGVFLDETSPGTWTGSLDIGTGRYSDDLRLSPHCGSWSGDVVIVDVDNPQLFALPFSVPAFDIPDPPEEYLGTDCPPGTTAHVLFQAQGRPAPEVRTPPLDDRGDWRVTVPDFANGTHVEVSASCGSVSYPSTSYTAGGSQYATTTTSLFQDPGSTTTTTTSAASDGAATAATPATPVATAAAYTG